MENMCTQVPRIVSIAAECHYILLLCALLIIADLAAIFFTIALYKEKFIIFNFV